MDKHSPTALVLGWLTVVGSLGVTPLALGETWVIPASADARIIRIGTEAGYQNSNYQSDILSVYNTGDNEQRTLVHFDLDSVNLPAGQRLRSATLRLVASTGYGGNPQGQPMEVWRVNRPWMESRVTWLQATDSTPWTSPGGDFSGLGERPYAVSVSQPGHNGPVMWDLTELVATWLEGMLPNHGLLLKSHSPNGLTFIQRELGGGSGSPDGPLLLLESGPGVPQLLGSLDTATGEIVLSWQGVGTAVLQHRASFASDADWVDVGMHPGVEGSRSIVRQQTVGEARLFRLRLP